MNDSTDEVTLSINEKKTTEYEIVPRFGNESNSQQSKLISTIMSFQIRGV